MKLAELAGVQRRQLSTLEQGGNITLKTLEGSFAVRIATLDLQLRHADTGTMRGLLVELIEVAQGFCSFSMEKRGVQELAH